MKRKAAGGKEGREKKKRKEGEGGEDGVDDVYLTRVKVCFFLSFLSFLFISFHFFSFLFISFSIPTLLSQTQTHLAKKIRPKELINLEEKKKVVGREKETEDLLVQIKGACVGMKSTISIVFGAPGSGKSMLFFFFFFFFFFYSLFFFFSSSYSFSSYILFFFSYSKFSPLAYFVNETIKQYLSQQSQQTTKKKKQKIHVLSLNGKLHSNQRHALHTLLVQFSEQESRNGATLSEITVWCCCC